MVKYLQIRSSKESRESRKTGLMLYARTYRNCIRPNDRSNSCVHRNVSREGYITCLDKPIRCPGNNVPFQRIFKNGENVKLAKRNEFELQSFYRCAYLKASVSRRWHFCLLIRQKPAHPVGSLGSLGILQIGTSSSTRATQTSFGKQSSQYLVELKFDSIGLVTSASVSDVSWV